MDKGLKLRNAVLKYIQQQFKAGLEVSTTLLQRKFQITHKCAESYIQLVRFFR